MLVTFVFVISCLIEACLMFFAIVAFQQNEMLPSTWFVALAIYLHVTRGTVIRLATLLADDDNEQND